MSANLRRVATSPRDPPPRDDGGGQGTGDPRRWSRHRAPASGAGVRAFVSRVFSSALDERTRGNERHDENDRDRARGAQGREPRAPVPRCVEVTERGRPRREVASRAKCDGDCFLASVASRARRCLRLTHCTRTSAFTQLRKRVADSSITVPSILQVSLGDAREHEAGLMHSGRARTSSCRAANAACPPSITTAEREQRRAPTAGRRAAARHRTPRTRITASPAARQKPLRHLGTAGPPT